VPKDKEHPRGAPESHENHEAQKHHRATHELYITSASALKRRAWKVSRLVQAMRVQMPWLQQSDLPVLRSWCEHEIIGSAIFTDLMEQGIRDAMGEPRSRLIEAWKGVRGSQLRYSTALGLSPLARASISAAADGVAIDIAQHLTDRALTISESRAGKGVKQEGEEVAVDGKEIE
jgi:hypothetical protein